MLRNDRTRTSITLFCVLFSFSTSTLLAAPWCAATDLEANTVRRSFAAVEDFRLHVPAAGVVTLDLLASGTHVAMIHVLSGECGEPTADALIVERSATHLVLALRTAGTLNVRAATAAPGFKLVSAFSAAHVVGEAFERDGLRLVQTSYLANRFVPKGDPEDVEPDADGLNVSPHQGSRLLASFLALRDVLGHTLLRQPLFYDPICRRTEIDDHGDTASCATTPRPWTEHRRRDRQRLGRRR